MRKKKIYVHIADDHKIVIEGIVAVINTDNEIAINGYSLTGAEVIDFFDKKGNRVGYGKGFYDKFFAQLSPKAIKIGLSFFDVEEEITDTNPLDIKLDYCLTPNNLYTFDK